MNLVSVVNETLFIHLCDNNTEAMRLVKAVKEKVFAT